MTKNQKYLNKYLQYNNNPPIKILNLYKYNRYNVMKSSSIKKKKKTQKYIHIYVYISICLSVY